MKQKIIKPLSLINVIGPSFISITLFLFIFINPFIWSELIIALNLLLTIPIIFSGIVILRNIETINKRKIKKTLIAVFLMLWIPSIALPFAFEVGGFLICLLILTFGLIAVIKVKNTLNKMILMNVLGTIFLIFNSIVLLVVISENI